MAFSCSADKPLSAPGFTESPNVFVSNLHVLLAHGAGPGDAVYRTSLADRGGTVIVRGEDAEPFAEIEDTGAEENYIFRYPGDAPAPYFVDCATARILSDCVDSAASLKPRLRISRIHPLDVVGGRVVDVCKAGSTRTGRVIDAAAMVQTGGVRRTGNLAIQCREALFAGPGDSGALIFNERGQAVGMLWGRNEQNPAIAYACHIHPVLDRLQVTILAGELP